MNDFNASAVRERSWQMVEKAGLRSNSTLPLLETDRELIPSGLIVARLLCMSAAAAHAFGHPAVAANAWIDRERLRDSLSSVEQAFLSGAQEHLIACQMQVHGVYTLAWCLSVVDAFHANEKMPDDLVHLLPDIKNGQSSASFRLGVVLRSREQILTQLDSAYCFHWAWRDAYLSSNRNRRENNMLSVAERRRALEWVFEGGDWDT